jgi:AraC family transcriptional regulator, transcriptional activator of pobA
MSQQPTFTFANGRMGNAEFNYFTFSDNSAFDHLQRNDHYSLIWVTRGTGSVKAYFTEYKLEDNMLFAFAPYQPWLFSVTGPMEGVAIYFNPDFFCIHRHNEAVACNGIVFNNVYESPSVKIDADSVAVFRTLCEQIGAELQRPGLAQYDLLVAYLKIFLIAASRLKTQQQEQDNTRIKGDQTPFILLQLKDAIEKHHRMKHLPSDYAALLHLSPKTLAKITRSHFNKTLSDLINERIIIEAKRELYLTNKPVKEIAHELGYEDAHYFSRFFKVNAGISPQKYRDRVGYGRGTA